MRGGCDGGGAVGAAVERVWAIPIPLLEPPTLPSPSLEENGEDDAYGYAGLSYADEVLYREDRCCCCRNRLERYMELQRIAQEGTRSHNRTDAKKPS